MGLAKEDTCLLSNTQIYGTLTCVVRFTWSQVHPLAMPTIWLHASCVSSGLIELWKWCIDMGVPGAMSLNMVTCSIIFWSLVFPTALFGCELWRLNSSSNKLVEDFQLYAGWHVRRFYYRTPNVCSFLLYDGYALRELSR